MIDKYSKINDNIQYTIVVFVAWTIIELMGSELKIVCSNSKGLGVKRK